MNATETLESLRHAVNAAPLDAEARMVYADALEEAGVLASADENRAFAALLLAPVNAGLCVRIAAALTKANGKRRARRLSVHDVEVCIRRASKAGIRAAFVDGGGVANSYGYAAATSLVLVVIRANGKVCIDGGLAAARKTGGSPANIWPELVQWNEKSKTMPARLAAWAAAR